MKHFKASWSTSLIAISAVVTLLCFGIGAWMTWKLQGNLSWIALLAFAIVIGSIPFGIRGYSITADSILIHRLFWDNRLSRADLQAADFLPNVMRGSIRVCANGGVFSFSGYFYKKGLGIYRAFVANQAQTVVLHFPRRKVIISPNHPEEFVNELALLSGDTQSQGT